MLMYLTHTPQPLHTAGTTVAPCQGAARVHHPQAGRLAWVCSSCSCSSCQASRMPSSLQGRVVQPLSKAHEACSRPARPCYRRPRAWGPPRPRPSMGKLLVLVVLSDALHIHLLTFPPSVTNHHGTYTHIGCYGTRVLTLALGTAAAVPPRRKPSGAAGTCS